MDIYPIGDLSAKLRMLLKVNLAVTVTATFAGFYQYISYMKLKQDVNFNEVVLPSDVITGVVGITQLIVYLIVAITFLRWLYQINKNLHKLTSEPMEFTPGWSVGWYFVPIANLFKPYQAMKEICDLSEVDENGSHTLLKWWWALWIISEFFGRLAFKLAIKANDLSSYNASNLVDIVSDGMDLPLIIVALILVTRINTGYHRKYLDQPPTAVFAAET